jgi:hypothetical protein
MVILFFGPQFRDPSAHVIHYLLDGGASAG